jgi:hypothetical protein
MVHKVKNSDLKSFLGDDWIQIHNRKIQQQAMRDIRGRQGIMFSLTSVMMTFVLLVILRKTITEQHHFSAVEQYFFFHNKSASAKQGEKWLFCDAV